MQLRGMEFGTTGLLVAPHGMPASSQGTRLVASSNNDIHKLTEAEQSRGDDLESLPGHHASRLTRGGCAIQTWTTD
jgi:hypothetical protein